MADNNKQNGLPPDWVQDCNRVMTNWQNGNKEAWIKSKSITFDPIAQANLPKDVKAKMEADRYTAEVGNKERISKIEKILNDYRRQEDFSDYRLSAYIAKHLK